MWLTHPSSQWVITLVDIFFFITDAKLKWPFLFPVFKNAVSDMFHPHQKYTPPQIMDFFPWYSTFKLCKMKVVTCISAKLAFMLALLWGWKISLIKTVLCLVSKSAKMIDYLKSVQNSIANFRSHMIYCLIFYILHCNFQKTLKAIKDRHIT